MIHHPFSAQQRQYFPNQFEIHLWSLNYVAEVLILILNFPENAMFLILKKCSTHGVIKIKVKQNQSLLFFPTSLGIAIRLFLLK